MYVCDALLYSVNLRTSGDLSM